MLRLEWVEEQMERLRTGTCTMQSVRDYAALCIVRDSLLGAGEGNPIPYYDPAYDNIPTLDQVEQALGAVATNTEADRQRARDAMTWARIIRGE